MYVGRADGRRSPAERLGAPLESGEIMRRSLAGGLSAAVELAPITLPADTFHRQL